MSVLISKSRTRVVRRGGQVIQPSNPNDPRPPFVSGGNGIGIRLNGLVIGGVKRFIEPNDLLDIPSNWEYNVFALDVEGDIDIDADGMINIMDEGFLIETQNYVATAIDYTATNTDFIIEATGVGITITLLTSMVGQIGKAYKIDNSSGGDIFVVGETNELIQGIALQTVPNNNCMNIFANGISWRIS